MSAARLNSYTATHIIATVQKVIGTLVLITAVLLYAAVSFRDGFDVKTTLTFAWGFGVGIGLVASGELLAMMRDIARNTQKLAMDSSKEA